MSLMWVASMLRVHLTHCHSVTFRVESWWGRGRAAVGQHMAWWWNIAAAVSLEVTGSLFEQSSSTTFSVGNRHHPISYLDIFLHWSTGLILCFGRGRSWGTLPVCEVTYLSHTYTYTSIHRYIDTSILCTSRMVGELTCESKVLVMHRFAELEGLLPKS